MSERGTGSDGAISDLPWSSVFDPAINVRALGEIQARGFRAAADLVDRFVHIAEPNLSTAAESGPKPEPAAAPRERPSSATAPDVERLVESWKGIIGQLAGSLRAGAPDRNGGAKFDLVDGQAGGAVVLEATGSGVISTEVWLHNGGPTDLGAIALRCSDLLAHDGSVIDSARLSFDPRTVEMPGRCSRGISIQADIGEHVVPGRYHGTLLVDGHPDSWLPITLSVTMPPA